MLILLMLFNLYLDSFFSIKTNRIIEWSGFEGILNIAQFQTPPSTPGEVSQGRSRGGQSPALLFPTTPLLLDPKILLAFFSMTTV